MKDVWTVRHLAQHLGINKNRLREWRRAGIGPTPTDDGRRITYREADVAAWIAEHPNGRP
jgi:predicted site-specific integrase-resolvase